MNILISILLSVDVLVALLMILVILMQRPKSEGLGAAFGGGVTENIFGAQTTNVLTKITGWLAGIFFFVTFILSILYAERSMGGSNVRRELARAGQASSEAVSPSPTMSPAGAVPSQSPAAAASSSVKPADLAAGAAVPASKPGVPASTATPSATATPPPSP